MLRVAAQFRMIIYAVIMIAGIILWPYGLAGKPKEKKLEEGELIPPDTQGKKPAVITFATSKPALAAPSAGCCRKRPYFTKHPGGKRYY